MDNEKIDQKKEANRSIMIVLGIIVAALAVTAIAGFMFMNKPAEIVEGQAEGTTVRISGKLPGRVVEFYVHEGDTVKAGDTLVHIHSSVAEAQLTQAEAMRQAAKAQNRKVDAGTRSQIIKAAHDLLQQATAAVTITGKTYERIENLYKSGVVSEQKRDEAKAAYDAAVAAQGAAESQYSLALAGAQSEDKQASAAMVNAADGSVEQVNAILEDSYLVAPYDGTIDEIYPEAGELVSMFAKSCSTTSRWVKRSQSWCPLSANAKSKSKSTTSATWVLTPFGTQPSQQANGTAAPLRSKLVRSKKLQTFAPVCPLSTRNNIACLQV
jgi:HlyD family secretion protein